MIGNVSFEVFGDHDDEPGVVTMRHEKRAKFAFQIVDRVDAHEEA